MTSTIKPQQEAEILLNRYEQEPEHTRQVAKLALQLFDGLKEWHERGSEERTLLEIAALLHDIGWSQAADGKGHHKQSAKLIAEYEWKSLTAEQITIAAQTARYHRKALPKSSHERFVALSAKDRKLVCQLGGMLRLADGLDRSHRQLVKKVKVKIDEKHIRLSIESEKDCDVEREIIETKADLLEMISERKVSVD